MKNGTRSLYTLFQDPKPIATKKRTSNLRKKILLGAFVASGITAAFWSFDKYQTMQAKAEYLEYAVTHNKPLEKALLEWGKIQYLKTHSALPMEPQSPVPGPGAWLITDLMRQDYRNALLRYNEQFLK